MKIRRFKWNPAKPDEWGPEWQYLEFHDNTCFASRSDKQVVHDIPSWDLADAERLVAEGSWLEIQPHIQQMPGDWPEDFDHENGLYNHICCRCPNWFIGHKRRTLCKVCDRQAIEAAPEAVSARPARLELYVTTEAGTEVRRLPSIHSQELFDHFRNFRYAKVGVNGLGSVYTDAVTHIDNEVQRIVREFLKGIP